MESTKPLTYEEVRKVLTDKEIRKLEATYAQTHGGIDCIFDVDCFRGIVDELSAGNAARYQVDENDFIVRPLPNGTKLNFPPGWQDDDGGTLLVLSKHGRAPRSMRLGNIYCTKHPATQRLIFFKISSGIPQVAGYTDPYRHSRMAWWQYPRVRIPMGSKQLS